MGREAPPHRVKEYRLALDVDFDTLDFGGTIGIDLEGVAGPVLLNSVGLEIDRVSSADTDLTFVPVPEEEGFRVEGLTGPEGTIDVAFRGRVEEQSLQGFYQSRFGDYSLFTTQCAAIGARRVFPCLDRPDRKAPFNFELTVDVDDGAIFNTPVIEQRTKGSRKRLTFLPTPPMATYLFYLGVGPFEQLRGRAGQIRLSVVAPIGRAATGQFALDHAAKVLPALEEYFRIPYPLSKLDLIAVPDFAYGAMENWGAITFREMRLLVDGTTSSRARRLNVMTLAHEMAHQWFGNLVTMAWWDDVWLNESFATFMEPKILAPLYPETHALPEYLIDWTFPALVGDSLPRTHAVQQPVDRPSEVAEVFDEISYGKGATVLRMVDAFLGGDVFRTGVQHYLEKFRYANARGEDLWASIEESAGRPVAGLMQSWIGRPGLPVVTARLAGETLFLEQHRYVIGEPIADPPWPIPVVLRLNEETRRVMFSASHLEVPVGDVAFAHLNHGATGFYRVRYDAGLYTKIFARWPQLPAADRWSVIQDLYAFLFSGDVDLEQYLRAVEATRSAPEPLSVLELVREYVGLMVPREPPVLGFLLHRHAGYQAAFRRFLSDEFDRLGPSATPGEPADRGVLRAAVANALVWSDPGRAREFADRYAVVDEVDADVRSAVLLAFGHTGGPAEHGALLEHLKETKDESEAYRCELALAAFRGPSEVAATVDLLGTDAIRRNHLVNVVIALAQNPDARDAAWGWIAGKGAEVMARFPGTSFATDLLAGAVPYAGIGREEEAYQFLDRNPWPESARGARKARDLLQATTSLVRRLSG